MNDSINVYVINKTTILSPVFHPLALNCQKRITDPSDEHVNIEAMKLKKKTTLPALRFLLESIQIKQKEDKKKKL
jgi:hypothetical protein